MPDFRYGPVELYVIGLDGARPGAGAIQALHDLVDSGLVRILDFVVVSKSIEGALVRSEVEDDPAHYGLDGIEPLASGLAGDTDIDEFAPLMTAGSTAAIVALELVFQRRLAERLAASGATVLASQRIPAPVVNAVVDAIDPVSEGH